MHGSHGWGNVQAGAQQPDEQLKRERDAALAAEHDAARKAADAEHNKAENARVQGEAERRDTEQGIAPAADQETGNALGQ